MQISSRSIFNDIRIGALCRYIEEELDLPAVLVDGRDGAPAQLMMIGQEHQNIAAVGAHRLDTAQQMRTLLLGADAA
jgi:hypothetical protein